MNIDLAPLFAFGLALVLTVFALAIWRREVAKHEDDTLHVLEPGVIRHQISVAHKLDVLDRWGIALTVVVSVYLAVVLVLFEYQHWVRAGRLP